MSSEVVVVVVPDGGWGWVIVACSFLIHMFVVGSLYALSVLYVEWLHVFGAGKGLTSWSISLAVAVMFGIGPLPGAVARRFGNRIVVVMGGVLMAVGFLCSFFAMDVYFLIVTIGVVTGTGAGFCYLPSLSMIAMYFTARRSIAMGISASGLGAGAFLMGPLLNWLVDYYGWRGTMLIMSGISLNMCVLGVLMRPLEKAPRCRNCRWVTADDADMASRDFSVHSMKRSTGRNDDVGVSEGEDDCLEVCAETCCRDVGAGSGLGVGGGGGGGEEGGGGDVRGGFMGACGKPGRTCMYASRTPLEMESTTAVARPLVCFPAANQALIGQYQGSGRIRLEKGQRYDSLPCVTADMGLDKTDGWNMEVRVSADSNTRLDLSDRGRSRDDSSSANHESLIVNSVQLRHITPPLHPALTRLIGNNNKAPGLLNGSSLPLLCPGIQSIDKSNPTNWSFQVMTTSPQTRCDSDYIPAKMCSSNCSLHPTPPPTSPPLSSHSTRRHLHGHGTVSSSFRDLEVMMASSMGSLVFMNHFTNSALSLHSKPSSVAAQTGLDVALGGTEDVYYDRDDNDESSCLGKAKVIIGTYSQLLRNWTFLIFGISNFFTNLSFFMPVLYMVDRARHYGIEKGDAAMLISLYGAGNIFGKLFFGWLADRGLVDRLFYYIAALAMCGLSTAFSPLCGSNHVLHSVYAFTFGCFIGAYVTLVSVVTVDLMGMAMLGETYGMLLCFMGVATAFGSPVAGWIFDKTGSYDISFILHGVFILLSALMLVPLLLMKRK